MKQTFKVYAKKMMFSSCFVSVIFFFLILVQLCQFYFPLHCFALSVVLV